MGGPEPRHPDEADNEFMRGLILEQSKTNRRTLSFAFCLIAIVFFVALLTAVRTGASVPAILGVAGIGGGCEAGLLTWVWRLWKEYNKFGFLLILSRSLPPEDLMKAVGAMFFAPGTQPETISVGRAPA
jgi:hypothetical protein